MEIGLAILAALGALLFLSGYLGFVAAGFRYHFITGLIAMIPVINVLTVPALWRDARRKVISAAIGLAILVSSWFLGANTGIQQVIGMIKGENPTLSSPMNLSTQSGADVALAEAKVDESKLFTLPKKALYRMGFEVVSLDQISTLKNKIVQIIKNNGDKLEGRVIQITASSVFIDNREIPIANIKQISLMIKKPNE